jgi:hypothetical protein
MNTLKVKGMNLVREKNSKAILNTDKKGLEEYYMKKEIAKKQNEKHDSYDNRLKGLESEMSEIKNLLTTLINKL